MTLKQLVKNLNSRHIDNSFKLSELAVKRDINKVYGAGSKTCFTSRK